MALGGGQLRSRVQQWNWVHEAIIEQWKGLAPYVFEPLYFFFTNTDKEGEDFVTISYLADLAQQAGLRSIITEIEAIGLSDNGFVDANGDRIRTAYKMYPWERMIRDAYGRDAIHHYGNGLDDTTMWIEPIWKMLWSNKGILPVLWHLFPDHQNLLPAYFEKDGKPVDVFGNALSPEAEDQLTDTASSASRCSATRAPTSRSSPAARAPWSSRGRTRASAKKASCSSS